MKPFRNEPEPSKRCVRDLRPGMTVPINGTDAIVASVERMDGENGEPPMMIANHKSILGADADFQNFKTAVAMRVHFLDHEPVIAHPGEAVK